MVQSYRPCTLHQISAHVWWYVPEERTDRPSLGAVVGSERVLLLDIGASVAHTRSFLDALHVQGISSPDYAVLTHWHWDHVFGIDALTCPIIAHIETSENIARMITLDYSNDNLPNLVAQGHEVEFTREHMIIELSNTQRQNLNLRLPDITFDNQLTIHLGDVSCTIQHIDGDHASDAVVIHIQEDSVLFLGDCFYYTIYQLPQHFTKTKLLPLINKLEAFDADTYIIGHADDLYMKHEMQQEFALIREIYSLLDQHSSQSLQAIKSDLNQQFDSDDIDYYLQAILAGINLES